MSGHLELVELVSAPLLGEEDHAIFGGLGRLDPDREA
jgi:hypothetical protein